MLTAERRTELDRAKHGKAIRVAVYDLGIFIGALYGASKIEVMWPDLIWSAYIFAGGLWVGLITARTQDWKALTYLETRLDGDEDEADEREIERMRFVDD